MSVVFIGDKENLLIHDEFTGLINNIDKTFVVKNGRIISTIIHLEPQKEMFKRFTEKGTTQS